jgi:mRNA-degrading endonuclease YafQ of YafQ-DinJ toxin-antitoxin module
MSDARTSEIKGDWKGAQNAAPMSQSKLIELVRLLARNAATRDFKHHMEEQERTESDD